MLLTSGAATFMVEQPDRRRHELAAALHLLHGPQRRARWRSSAPSPPPPCCCLVLVLFVIARLMARPRRGGTSRSAAPSGRLRRGPGHGRPARRAWARVRPASHRTEENLVIRSVLRPCSACGACSPCRGDEPPADRSDARPARADVRPDRGHRLDLVRADRPAVDRRRRRQRHEGRLHRRRLDQGPQGLLAEQHRLRDLRDPLPGHRRAGATPTPATAAPFAYLPIVAGGTAFTYQLKIGNELVRNLRLSGETLAKIFTNQITNWNDPAITKDNNGRDVPVAADHPGRALRRLRHDGAVHDLDGQRSTPNIWRPYFGQSGLTSYYPQARVTGWSARPAPTR